MSLSMPKKREGQIAPDLNRSRHLFIGGTLVIALFAFEIFNFDTTKYALSSLLGDVRFAGVQWAAILAIAFCAIDFAGLARIFTPQTEFGDEPKEVWYLMGAWLLGATMNAIMTWWAVSLTLLENPVGNAVLSGEILLKVVPVFVAVLVWLTRILFIGALSVTGDRVFGQRDVVRVVKQPAQKAKPSRSTQKATRAKAKPKAKPTAKKQPAAATIRSNTGVSYRQRTVVDEIDDFEEQPTLFIEQEPVAPPPTRTRKPQPRATTRGHIRPQRGGMRPNVRPATAQSKNYDN